MFSNYMYHGKSLSDWQKELNYEFSLGELYRYAIEGRNFPIVPRCKSTISEI